MNGLRDNTLRGWASVCGPYAMLVVCVVFVMTLLSIDSPLYDMLDHIDSAWFMMGGRAWMHGFTPYVDFTDSKGPLIWLIYGIGYLLSPGNYTGVFIVSALFYALTCFVLYRTALLFLPGHRWLAVCCSALTLLAFFNPLLHFDTRIEDFAQLFFSISLYVTCRAIYAPSSSKPRSHWRSALVVGLCMGALLMMKFTLAVMPAIFVAYLAIDGWRRNGWHTSVAVVAATFAGIAAAVLPFLVYFLAIGHLRDAVNEYFLNTITNGDNVSNWKLLVASVRGGARTWYLIIMGLATGVSGLFLHRYRAFPLVSFLFFYAIATVHSLWLYYFNSCNFLAVFGGIALAIWLMHGQRRRIMAALPVVTVAVLTLYATFWARQRESFVTNWGARHEAFNAAVTNLRNMGEHPTIVYLNCQTSPNISDPLQAFPGCKDWAKQSNASQQLVEAQRQQVLQRRPDIVVIPDADSCRTLATMLDSMGYQPQPYPQKLLYHKQQPVH